MKDQKLFFIIIFLVALGITLLFFFEKDRPSPTSSNENENADKVHQTTNAHQITIDYNAIRIKALMSEPKAEEVDMLLTFHGTTMDDSKSLKAAENILVWTKSIIEKKDIMIISVAYPQEGMLIGDNIKEAEATLLWLKNNAEEELGLKIDKIYLFGHSLGGYLVTRLNTMHETDGVIANAPGPLDLVFRCKRLEKSQNIKNEITCSSLKEKYGSVFDNPGPYEKRSLLDFTSGYKSKILFVQGMEDKQIQLTGWSKFRPKVEQCANCQETLFLELEDSEHRSIFQNNQAKTAVNKFLSD